MNKSIYYRFIRQLGLQVLGMLACMCLFPVNQAGAATRQDISQLQQLATGYIQSQLQNRPGNITVNVMPLDTRLNLVQCKSPEVFMPPGARLVGRSSIGVRCANPAKWSVTLQTSISIITEVAISSRPLALGTTLTPDDVTTQVRDLADMPATVLTDPNQAVGRALVTALPAGAILKNEHFRAAFAVLQNQSVRVIAQNSAFRIETQGKALNNAMPGQVVNIRTSSGQTIQGIAQPGGIVLIEIP
ncbi:flagellar basal body P-ring formation chaperone FlgA [Leeia oryzae]|uniref:flagellar basal body P-ring formation chaperone FlgA n=1 Tax=Leeia oryzae TaxID=356662 RepID=UPI00037EA4DF|nr:flagellar basal body P-ring formation chaperone FlgA [Leeia oryzae]